MLEPFRDLPAHLTDAFDEPPLLSDSVTDHTAPPPVLRPEVYNKRFAELVRPVMSESEAKARAASRKPPSEIQVWLSEMLTRKGMRPDEMLMLWDPMLPRWSFWCRSKHDGAETGYARVWIVGELEARSRGQATDLDERSEKLKTTMGPYRLPERHEIDWVIGEVATMGPAELDNYLTAKERASEEAKEKDFSDWAMDFYDYAKEAEIYKLNGGIRTWCKLGDGTSDAERERKRLEREGIREIDMGNHKVRVKIGSRFEKAALDELAERERKAEERWEKDEEKRVLQYTARQAALGRVRASRKQRTM